MGLNRWLGCIENPLTGRESEWSVSAPRTPKHVLVVGAGPRGCRRRSPRRATATV